MVAAEKDKNQLNNELLKEIDPFNYRQKRFDSLWKQRDWRVLIAYVSDNYNNDYRIRYSASTTNKEEIQMRKRSQSA